MFRTVSAFPLVLLVLTICQGAFPPEQIPIMHRHCMKQSELSEERFEIAKKGDISNPNQELKCYIKCILTTVKGLYPNGTFDLENLFNALPENYPQKGFDAIRQCYLQADSFDADLCNRSHQIWACAQKLSPDTWYFV